MKGQAKEAKLTTWTFVAQVPHKVMVGKFQIQASCSSIALAKLFALHHLVLYMVGCLCHDSNS